MSPSLLHMTRFHFLFVGGCVEYSFNLTDPSTIRPWYLLGACNYYCVNHRMFTIAFFLFKLLQFSFLISLICLLFSSWWSCLVMIPKPDAPQRIYPPIWKNFTQTCASPRAQVWQGLACEVHWKASKEHRMLHTRVEEFRDWQLAKKGRSSHLHSYQSISLCSHLPLSTQDAPTSGG